MPIHFNQTHIQKVLKTIKDAHDMTDVNNDVRNIEQTMSRLQATANPLSFVEIEEHNRVRQCAEKLDEILRKKYPTINTMLDAADLFARRPAAITIHSLVKEGILSNLEQDYYGILCDTALKKSIIGSINDIIDYVD